jgi:tetratricopeptide (TPR) repeat protein
MEGGGKLDVQGWLIAEPENPVDANAVAVHTDGERIGYLPSHLAAQLSLKPNDPYPCQLQLWGEEKKGKLRVIGWVAAGTGVVAWPHTPQNPPPISPEAERAARANAITKMVDDALEGRDPERAVQFAAGMVAGYHYLEMIEPIKELKRHGRLEEALILCYAAIQGAENAREGREPPVGYTLEAAIIHRKLGQIDQEIAILKRWLKLCPAKHRHETEAYRRLTKLTESQSKRRTATN